MQRLPAAKVPERAREVELPVCPVCGLVAKQPAGHGVGYACRGPVDAQHKKTPLRLVRYVVEQPSLTEPIDGENREPSRSRTEGENRDG